MKIIYQDSNFLVIDKPANLTVHPINENQKDTLADQVLESYPEIKNVGDNPLRPGIIHRLDKDTSGLILVAKNNDSFKYFKNLFQEREIDKKYLALVHGIVKDDKGTITKSISFSKKDFKKRSAFLDENSKPAVTKYLVIERFKDYTLLEASPKTGRTHQIRIHCHSIGYPIVGDKQYKFKRKITPKSLNRQFLHASYLKFKDIDGKMMEFKSELPSDLKEVLENIQKHE